MIVTADVLISKWIFGEDFKKAKTKAIEMGIEILLMQENTVQRDVNLKSTQHLIDWIRSGENQFINDTHGEKRGFIEGTKYYIYPTLLNEELKDKGISARKTLKFLNDKGVISKDSCGKFSIMKHFNGKRSRFVEFDFTKASALLQSASNDPNEKMIQEGFEPVDEDDDLPF